MKKVALSLLVFSGALMASPSYNVNVSSKEGQIHVRFTTKKTFSSMCTLSNTEVKLSLGDLAFGGEVEVNKGLIDLKARTLPHTMCMMAFGPHRGGISFNRGYSLPSLPNGEYSLRINGENAGTLLVKEGSASLE